jgi:hypothetical protein
MDRMEGKDQGREKRYPTRLWEGQAIIGKDRSEPVHTQDGQKMKEDIGEMKTERVESPERVIEQIAQGDDRSVETTGTPEPLTKIPGEIERNTMVILQPSIANDVEIIIPDETVP